MPKLTVSLQPYDPDALGAWTRRQRNALSFPATAADLERLLKRKARGRAAKTRRFFGEAYIASQTRYREAYYSSFKWLTNPRFAGDRKLRDKNQEQLRKALQDHFTPKRIAKLQRVVRELSGVCRKDLAGKHPTPPDLWLVGRGGRHRFIEVKLPGDSLAPHQIAGMAAIACVLSGPKRVSIEVVHLDDDCRLFTSFCRAVRAR